MRSFLTRLALVGIVGIAFAGCNGGNGTSLPGGALPGGSGGGPINTTPGIGPAPPGFVAPFLIDNGAGPAFVGFNTIVGSDALNPVDSPTDPTVPGLPPPPAEPDGVLTASHAFTFSGNNSTQIILRLATSKNLTYTFGAPGNLGFFTYGSIISHFWLGEPAQGTATITGTATAGDWVSIAINGVGSTYNVVAGDTTASIAQGLIAAINGNAAINASAFASQSFGAPNAVIVTWRTPGTGGNGITLTSSKSPGATEVITTTGTLANGVASGTLGAPASWAIELVGNGSNAGPGTAANTYDVRIPCTSTPAVFSGGVLVPPGQTFRFSCGPLPAYGTLMNTTPGTATPLNAVFPAAAGAFTPVNTQIYVVLNYATTTNPAFSQLAGIDNMYAIQ